MIERDVYIFLDVDGVLNNAQLFERHHQYWQKGIEIPYIYQDIDYNCVMVFKKLCSQLSHCHIILSSSWRNHTKLVNQLEMLFQHHNLPPIEGKTHRLNTWRGVEIQKYCKQHTISVNDIVILDDENDMEKLSHRLVQTDFYNGGLKEEHIEEVLQLLNIKMKSKEYEKYD